MSVTATTPELQQPTPLPEEAVHIEPGLEAEATQEANHHIAVFTSDDPEKGDAVKRAAQALHTRVYLREGFITEADIVDGVYLDDYADRSTYYFVRNGKKDAVARQINANKEDGIFSLPTFKNFSCDPVKVKQIADVSSLTNLRPSEVVEISALSSEKKNPQVKEGEVVETDDKLQDSLQAVPFLYAQMLRDSVEKGHKLWITNMEEPLVKAITGMIGSEQLVAVGEEKEYMGPATTPVALNPQDTIKSILNSELPYMDMYKEYIRTVFKGVDIEKAPKDFVELLEEHSIETSRGPFIKRTLASKEGRMQIAAQAGMLGYSMARIVPLVETDEFQGSTEALIATDIGTSFTYTYGALKMFTGNTVKDKLIGASVAIPSFIAPYGYYYAEGEGYPTHINAYVGALVVGAVGKEVISRVRARKNDKKIAERMENAGESSVEEPMSTGNFAVRSITRVKGRLSRKPKSQEDGARHT